MSRRNPVAAEMSRPEPMLHLININSGGGGGAHEMHSNIPDVNL